MQKAINTNPVAGGPNGGTTSGGMHYTSGAPTGTNSTPAGTGLHDTTGSSALPGSAVGGYSYGAEHSGDIGGAAGK